MKHVLKEKVSYSCIGTRTYTHLKDSGKPTRQQKTTRNTSHIKRLIRKYVVLSEKHGPLKNEADEIISDDSFMASILNKFFTSVFTTETFPLPESSEQDAFLWL